MGRKDSYSVSNEVTPELKASVSFVSNELAIENTVVHQINADIGAIDIQLTQTPTIVEFKYKQTVVPSITNSIEIPTDVECGYFRYYRCDGFNRNRMMFINLKYNASIEPNKEFTEMVQTVSGIIRGVADYIAEEITAYNEVKPKMETNEIVASKVSWCATEEIISEIMHSIGVQASEPQSIYSRDYIYGSHGVVVEPNIFVEQNDLVSSTMLADIPSGVIMEYSEQHELVSSQIQSSY